MDLPVAIVTGASRGIGLATALRLGAGGHALVIAARNAAGLQSAVERLRHENVPCEAVPVDVGTPAGAREVVQIALTRFGRVDVLVNNAGAAPRAALESLTDEHFQQVISANVASVFYMTRGVWTHMRQRGGGVIVNVSSVASMDPFPGFSVYGAAKAWVNVFTRAVAEEGRPHGIRVFAVAPGAVETRMLRDNFPDFPADRTLDPTDVARVICALCEPTWTPACGQTIVVRK